MKLVAKLLRTPFLQNTSRRLLLKFLQYLFLESLSFFVSLEKSVLLHRRCSMSKFSAILMLVFRKTFSAFYPILLETFSNSYCFPLMQEFNPFYPHLVLYYGKYFGSVLTDLSNLLFLFHQKLWSEDCSYKTVSKNAEAAVRKCSSEAVARRYSVKNAFLEISQNSQENNCVRVSF